MGRPLEQLEQKVLTLSKRFPVALVLPMLPDEMDRPALQGILAELVQVRRGRADFVASPGPATVAGVAVGVAPVTAAPDDIVLLDPVCGMTVERDHARHLAEHDGIVYAFCSLGCRTRFVKDPASFLSASADAGAPMSAKETR